MGFGHEPGLMPRHCGARDREGRSEAILRQATIACTITRWYAVLRLDVDQYQDVA